MNDMQSTMRAGDIIQGQYRVIDLLGHGAAGAVYLVKDERNPQIQFALKEVTQAVPENRRGFPFDASTLKRLNHPALPGIHRIFASDNHDRFYILMDYVEGSNLEVLQRSAPGRRFSLPRAMTLMSPIMDVVSYLHRQHPPLIHGDIKPSNIIALKSGTSTPAVLVDFGGTRDLHANADNAAGQGTLNYRAPEQFGKKASRRSDVYALGAIFYTLLTGTVPAAASYRLAQMGEGKPDPLVPMDQITPHVRTAVAQVISCALSLRRRDRFDTVEQFWGALWQVIYDDPQLAQLTDQADEGDSGLSSESDASMSWGAFPAQIADAPFQAEAAPAAASLGPPLSPALAGGGPPSERVPAQEGPPVLRRKKRRRVATSRADRARERNGAAPRVRKRRARTLILVGLVFLLVCVIGSGGAIVGYQTFHAKYQDGVALAEGGVKHLQTALSLMQALSKNPLDASSVTRAQREFAAASAVFARLETELQSFPGAATSIPVYGARLSAALRVVPLAQKISQAGTTGCDALAVIVSRFRDPLSVGQGLTTADLAEVGRDLHLLETDVTQATAQVNALQPTDLQLDARVGKAVAAFHRDLPSLQALLQTADQLLPALPALLGVGTPAFYLVELLDSTQLRPGGGFIKDYGFAILRGGRLSAAHVANASLLDSGFLASGQTLPYPPAYRWFDLASKSWSLRDSNLDADFPTAAGYAEQNYSREGGKVALRGVIAITPALMEQVLSITGAISLPELHETVTAQNLLDRIHYYELGPGYTGSGILSPNGHLSPSRYFTELLAEHFLARLHQLSSSGFPQLFRLLVSSLQTKDLQLYFNASPAENLLRLSHVDAAVQAPAGDSLLVVDANVAADTANQYITNTLDDRVTIDDRGNATHHTAIRYAWVKNGNLYGPPLYRDYVRIYVPPGSALLQQQGWQPKGTSESFGREVWAGFLTLSYGQARTVTLTWTVKGAAKEDAAGWHYQYLVQRQAGAQWTLNVQVTLPSCLVKMRPSGGLKSRNGLTTTLAQPLTEDMNLGIDYRC